MHGRTFNPRLTLLAFPRFLDRPDQPDSRRYISSCTTVNNGPRSLYLYKSGVGPDFRFFIFWLCTRYVYDYRFRDYHDRGSHGISSWSPNTGWTAATSKSVWIDQITQIDLRSAGQWSGKSTRNKTWMGKDFTREKNKSWKRFWCVFQTLAKEKISMR